MHCTSAKAHFRLGPRYAASTRPDCDGLDPSDEAPPQRILYVTSEIADYVKAGGLGEVSAALPRTLRQEYDVAS